MDGQRRRLKTFYDSSQKPKNRIQCLEQYLVTLEGKRETLEFYKENATVIFALVFDGFAHQKLKVQTKTGKIGLNSKEMTGLFRITALFRDLLKFAGNFVGDGLQRKTALAIIQSLLNYGNHHLVRIEGFRLLLLLMNSLSKESLDFIDMYQNAISINQVEGVEQSGSDIMTFFKTENVVNPDIIYPGEAQTMSETEVAQFFEEILFNFVVLNESKCFDNFDYAFSIFCDTFLVKLFPELGDESSKAKVFFKRVPSVLLRLFGRFVESFCLEKDSILNQITVYLLEPLILQIFKRPDDEKCLEVGFNLLNYLLTHHKDHEGILNRQTVPFTMNVLRYLDSLWSEAHTFYGLHIPLAVIRNIKDSSQILLSVNGVFDENSIWNAFCGLLVKITSALLTMTQSDRVQYSEITQSFLDLCFILCRNCSAEDTELWVKMRHLFGSAMDRGIDDIFLKSWSQSIDCQSTNFYRCYTDPSPETDIEDVEHRFLLSIPLPQQTRRNVIQRKDEALVGVPLLLQDDLFKEHGSADGSNEFVVHLKQPALAKLLSNFQNTLVAVGNVKEIRNAGALKSISLQIVKLYDAVLGNPKRNLMSKYSCAVFAFIPWLLHTAVMTDFDEQSTVLGCLCRVLSGYFEVESKVEFGFDRTQVSTIIQTVLDGLQSGSHSLLTAILNNSRFMFASGPQTAELLILIYPYFCCVESVLLLHKAESRYSDETIANCISILACLYGHCRALRGIDVLIPSPWRSKDGKYFNPTLLCRSIMDTLMASCKISRGQPYFPLLLRTLANNLITVQQGSETFDRILAEIVDNFRVQDLSASTAATEFASLIIRSKEVSARITEEYKNVIIECILDSIEYWTTSAADASGKAEQKADVTHRLITCLAFWMDACPSAHKFYQRISLFVDRLLREDRTGSDIVIGNLQNIFAHCCHFACNFPVVGGGDLIVSANAETPSEPVDSFVYMLRDKNNFGICANVETESIKGIFRDSFGKYEWDISANYSSQNNRHIIDQLGLGEQLNFTGGTSKQERVEDQHKPANTSCYEEIAERLQNFEFFQIFDKESSDNDINFSADFLSLHQQRTNSDVACNEAYKNDATNDTGLDSSFSLSVLERKWFRLIRPNASKSQISKQLMGRSFLTSLGLIGSLVGNHSSFAYLAPLKYSSSLQRDLRGLDKRFSRQSIKVAVIYVGPGQSNVTDILSNNLNSQAISRAYVDFVDRLGWQINVNKHSGFIGGLERNGTNGVKSTYYCDTFVEIIFHDICKMPNEADHKQLKKKRHVGNDHVHIVWNESGTKYQTDTIGGDFGNVQIIITPLESCGKSSLFSVTTFAAKENVVGPLSGTTILMENELAPLVRWTAVNAHCAVNQLKHTFEPVLQREADLGVIGERHVDQNILT